MQAILSHSFVSELARECFSSLLCKSGGPEGLEDPAVHLQLEERKGLDVAMQRICPMLADGPQCTLTGIHHPAGQAIIRGWEKFAGLSRGFAI